MKEIRYIIIILLSVIVLYSCDELKKTDYYLNKNWAVVSDFTVYLKGEDTIKIDTVFKNILVTDIWRFNPSNILVYSDYSKSSTEIIGRYNEFETKNRMWIDFTNSNDPSKYDTFKIKYVSFPSSILLTFDSLNSNYLKGNPIDSIKIYRNYKLLVSP